MKKLLILMLVVYSASLLYSAEVVVGFKYDPNFFLPQNEAYKKAHAGVMKQMKEEVGVDFTKSVKYMFAVAKMIESGEPQIALYGVGDFDIDKFQKYIGSSDKFKLTTVAGQKGVKIFPKFYCFLPEKNLFVITNRTDFSVLKTPKHILDIVTKNEFVIQIDNSDNSIPPSFFKKAPYLQGLKSAELIVSDDVVLKTTFRDEKAVPMIASMVNGLIKQGKTMAQMGLIKAQSTKVDPFSKNYGMDVVGFIALIAMLEDIEKKIIFKHEGNSISLRIPKEDLKIFPKSIGSPALIGVLAAIAIPNFQSARRLAKKRYCEANRKMLNNAVMMWKMDDPDCNIKDGTPVTDVHQLVEKKYMMQMPVCKDGGIYTFHNKDGEINVECSIHK
ncbi:hypothetical protein KAJ27_09635 [bacterium]|nr:hypothetical protein [bacterium]